MSATFRGAKRIAADFYKTPKAAFEPLLDALWECRCAFWEPACGDGRLIRWMLDFKIEAYGNDLDEGYDFLKDDSRRSGIVTNPPFSLAFEFCQHAVSNANHVFLLLRLSFLASQKRRDWFRIHEPSALFVLSERPSFTENGKTDACDYAWMYWGPTHKGIFHL